MKTSVGFLLLLLASANAFGQSFSDFFDVGIDAQKQDTYEQELLSYVSGELRSLQDVKIVDHRPTYRLLLISMPISVDGTKSGYTIAVVAEESTREWITVGMLQLKSRLDWKTESPDSLKGLRQAMDESFKRLYSTIQ